MLGELIGELWGNRGVRRVLSAEGSAFKVEVTFEETGKVQGFDARAVGTYTTASRPDGTLYSEGQGILLTKHAGMATWKGMGAGKFLEDGGTSFRGSICYNTASPQLAALNTHAVVFEFEQDMEGNSHSKLWEWK